MSVVLRFTAPVDVMACRWAISPLRETLSAVRLLIQPDRQGYHRPWLRSVAPALERLDLGPLRPVLPRRTYNPDFLIPPPASPRPRFEDELARVRATPLPQVARELTRCRREHYGTRRPATAGALAAEPAVARTQLADALEACWVRLIAPSWPRMLDGLESDILVRTATLADGGLAAVLADLHPAVRWHDDAITVEIDAVAERDLDRTGLLLMPSVFEWPGVGVTLDPPWRPTIDYPTRGIAALWPAVTGSPEHLRRLVGRTRAALLAGLAEPTSTTGLASRCQLPVSTVSEQLRVLRDAGLVDTHRVGRSLRHVRTPLGTALVHR